MSLVLWSGGADSTLVLLRLLKKKKPVRAISILHPQVMSGPRENLARISMAARFREDGYHLEHATIELKQDLFFIESVGGLTQPALWIPLALSYLRKDEDLYAGYIKGDDFWHYNAWAQQAFVGLNGVRGNYGSRFLMPLEWMEKAGVLKELYKKFPKYAKMVWYCEENRIVPCGSCASCRIHSAAMKELK